MATSARSGQCFACTPIEPGATVALPLVVGTASYKRALGYAEPPGEWLVEVVLRLGEGEPSSSSVATADRGVGRVNGLIKGVRGDCPLTTEQEDAGT